MVIDLGQVAQELGLPLLKVQRTVELLDEGNTVPFVTRYRKDQTGALDEEQIRQIQAKVIRLRMLLERKQTILKSIESQGKLTAELAEQISGAQSTKRLEDLYLPFKPKKQTLATVARQRGLEPLARELLEGSPAVADLDARAADFVSQDKQLHSVAEVLLGVGHLLAERFSERAELRDTLRNILWRTGKLVSQRVEGGTDPPQFGQGKPPVQAAAVSHAPESKPGPPESKPDAPPSKPDPPEPKADAPQSESEASQAEPPPLSASSEEALSEGALSDAALSADAVGEEPVGEEPVGEDAVGEDAVSEDAVGEDAVSEDAVGEDAVSEDAVGEEAVSETAGEPPADGPAAAPPSRTKSAARRGSKRKKRAKQDGAFKDYFDFREPLTRVPPHRILAINRGERAKILRVKVEADSEALVREAEKLLVPAEHQHADFLRGCARAALSRLVLPSLEREIRRELTEGAEDHAVEVFVQNLRKLLLQPPVRGRRVLAIDPGYRSGCKLIALDQFGNVLGDGLLYVVGDAQRRQQGRQALVELICQHDLSLIAIGNGTACRETEELVAEVISQELNQRDVAFVVVNEAGASVYSTSPLGREELPQYDAVLRSAVSIGRRLLDPLSELVKINPSNIGVGLYQHDVKARHLRDSLDAVVESCVNYVGVDVNTASPALLAYVSGLNQLTARRLYEFRCQHGPFCNREQFKQVPGFGEAAFVQAAGFLKIRSGDNPLDATWIHPESYDAARRLLEKLDSSVTELAHNLASTADQPAADQPAADQPAADRPARAGHQLPALFGRATRIDRERLAVELQISPLLLNDLLSALDRPGRDPREDLPPPMFRRGILKMEDLQPGMELSGTVLNVVDFGAFVDIGLSDSGLVHISRLANHYIRDPHEVVGVGDRLKVWVVEVDKRRRRVSLSALPPDAPRQTPARGSKPRAEADGNRPPRGGRPVQGPGREKRPPRAKPKARTRPAQPATPITKAMEEGKEPLRSFSDLLQFYEKKQDPPPKK